MYPFPPFPEALRSCILWHNFQGVLVVTKQLLVKGMCFWVRLFLLCYKATQVQADCLLHTYTLSSDFQLINEKLPSDWSASSLLICEKEILITFVDGSAQIQTEQCKLKIQYTKRDQDLWRDLWPENPYVNGILLSLDSCSHWRVVRWFCDFCVAPDVARPFSSS